MTTASLEKRLAWLENLTEVRQPTKISSLEDRIAALECIEIRRPDYEIALNNRIAALERAMFALKNAIINQPEIWS